MYLLLKVLLLCFKFLQVLKTRLLTSAQSIAAKQLKMTQTTLKHINLWQVVC